MMNFLILISILIVEVEGPSNVTGSHEPVMATVGKDAILPCHLMPPFNVSDLGVFWKYNGTDVHVYRSHGVGYVRDNRTSLFHEEMQTGNISLKLRNVTESDAGNYTCIIPSLESQVKRGKVTLIVDTMPTPTPTPKPPDRDLSTGEISGIVGGVVGPVVVVAVIALVLYLRKKRRENRSSSGQGGTGQENVPLNNM